MSQGPDEARAARIAKYKEERRKQLTARTATLFSANVTDRRGRKPAEQISTHSRADLKSSSEHNLNTASTSVPIRTTRTSRLRAAAANHSDSSLTLRRTNRSSSVQSLEDDKTKKPKSTKVIDRDKTKPVANKKLSHEKENLKSASTTCFPEKDYSYGAIRSTKPKHSIVKSILEKDKTNFLACTPKGKVVEDKLCSKLEATKKRNSTDITNLNEEVRPLIAVSNEALFDEILSDKCLSSNLESRKFDDLFKDIVDDKKSVSNTEDISKLDRNDISRQEILENHVNEISAVPNVVEEKSGLLEVVCVPKVKTFSELLNNLCSPGEADILFEDILADNGIKGTDVQGTAAPECSEPCRRTQPSPLATSPPKVTSDDGTKPKPRRSPESHLKTETSLPSSKLYPKSNNTYLPLPFGLKSSPLRTSSTSTPQKITEKRRSSDSGSKPSHIPITKKSTEKLNRSSASPVKQDSVKDSTPKQDRTPRSRTLRKSPEKAKSDTENYRSDKRHRLQRECENLSEKYHYSNKRLTSLENSPRDSSDAKKTSPKLLNNFQSNSKSNVKTRVGDSKDTSMSTLHETVRPHGSRLSQEMDSLAALTKQTLDRVNKLSNNLNSNKLNLESTEPKYDSLFSTTTEQKKNNNNHTYNYGLINKKQLINRGVSERLKDIDTAAQRLIDFEKQSAMFSDLSNDLSSQNRRPDTSLNSNGHIPVSILKRKSIHEDNTVSSTPNHAIASPPVTFSPNVVEPGSCRSDKRQGILKKRRSLDESQVARRRSCSPEVSFADDGSSDTNKPILKNRRSSLEDVVRNRSPDGQIQGILKRKMSREEEHINDDLSHSSPEPHGILKRKSNSSSSSSTTSSHVSIAQAVLLAAAGGAELVEEDKEAVRPILKKKSFSEERPCLEIVQSDTPKPILKKKSIEHEEYDFELPKRPILKSSKKFSSDDGHTSSFDLSEDDRSSRRSSLLRSRTSDHSGSECETTVRPILKQRGSSLTRERSQSPRPRLSFCADNDANIVMNFSTDANDLLAAGPQRVRNAAESQENFPSAVVRRRSLRPKSNARSKSLAGSVNDELLSILNDRRLKVDENCENGCSGPRQRVNSGETEEIGPPKTFPSIAARIKSMEQAFGKENPEKEPTTARARNRDKERFKTQPITIDEMRSASFSLEPGQASFHPFGTAACSFPSRPVEFGAAAPSTNGKPEKDPYSDFAKTLDSPPFEDFRAKLPVVNGLDCAKDDSFGEATFLDFENINAERRQSTLEEIEQEVNKVRVALDEDSRALEEDERHQAEVDNWSLNVSCDSGVYNRASSRDSGPHSGEELGLIESQEIQDNHATNSSSNEWSSSSVERGLIAMERTRKSTETEARPEENGSDEEESPTGFNLGLVKSNSVVARASMWQQLQQQAKGQPKPLIRHGRFKNKDGPSVVERFKTQPISFDTTTDVQPFNESFALAQSNSTAIVLDRDDDAKLDEDDPAKMSLMDKMKMFNSKLTHKPPVAGLPKPREDRSRTGRLKTMPVLSSQVQEALEQNERLTKSLCTEAPRNPDFQLKMELFRSASAKNTSLEYIMRQNSKFRSLDYDDDESPSEPAERMITPEVRGILKSGTTVVSKPKTLAKGESSEGLKDEGIDSSSDDESSASSVSSSEKSCSSSDSSDEIPVKVPDQKPRRFQRKNNKLKNSRTESDIVRLQESTPIRVETKNDARKFQLPGANELKERFSQAKNPDVKVPLLGKLARRPSDAEKKEDDAKIRRIVKNEPIQLGKLRREKLNQTIEDKPPPFLRISALNQEAKNKFFGIEPKKEKSIEELAAAVRKYIPPVSKSVSTHALEAGSHGSGSDGESSGGREVRHITTRVRHRLGGGGVQRSATQADMPHRGSTIAERLAALQAAGANDWRARVCRLSPDKEDSKAIERAKNKINETLNAAVDEKKKVVIEDTELEANILADRRTKLETAAQGWRKRVPQSDASLFTVAGRLERDKVNVTPPRTPPPNTPPPTPAVAPVTPATPGIPAPNKFRSRKQNSPTNGFASGPLRSASCAIVSQAAETKPKESPRHDRESFKRSHSVSESISRLDEDEESSPGPEKTGCPVRVPRADDETFQAFFAPVLQQEKPAADVDVDLDAIDSGHRQLLASEWARRAKRERKHAASRNPLRALAARTDIRDEYVAPPSALREQLVKEKATANCGLAASALAALASKEDFASVALRSASGSNVPAQGTRSLMLMQVKGRRRVQTRLVEPVHTNVNRGDCFILVTPDHVFLYIGLYANVIERNRSIDIANHIHNTKDLGCKSSTMVTIIDEQIKKYSNKHWSQFWSLLGLADGIEDYRPAETGHPDEDEIYESCIVQTNMCYEVADDELVPIKEYWGQIPKISMLHQSKTIVFDFGSEMYIWYGKNVPLETRRRAAQLAQELFDEGYNYEECHINPLNAAEYQGARELNENSYKSAKTRPDWAIFSKVTQHMETILFKEKFLDWPDYSRIIKVKPQESKTNSTEITPCDAEEMWSNEYLDPDLILEGSHLGRGTEYSDKESMRHFNISTQSVTKWIIQEYDFQKVENDAEIPEFFSGDSYIIRWDYLVTVSGRELNGKPSKHNVTGRDRCAYFCWQGKDASSNEKGAAALLTVELDREKGPQVRVAQGNEPAAFLNLFQGNLVIHQGKRDTDKSRFKLFVTRGNLTNEAYLLQVPCSVRQLRSRGSLLLVDTEKGCLYIWHGARSMKHTKNIAIELANKLIARKSTYLFGNNVSVDITEVKEGEEPKEVLEALGVANKQHYSSVLNGGKDCADVTPRLFHFTDLSGQFEAHEVLSPLRHERLVTPFPFEQKELYSASQPALFLLDDGVHVWLWQGWWPRGEDGELEPAERCFGVGSFAARWQALRAAALRTAEAYWRAARPGTERPDVRVVAAGLEPQAFTALFDTWTEHDEAADANIAHGYKSGEVLSGAVELSRLTAAAAVLPLAALQRRPLPDHVDGAHLERHLSSPDFLEAFGMTKEEFTGLPAWKQTNLKKDVGLF